MNLKRGRPVDGEAKNYRFEVRLTSEERGILDEICVNEDKTRADVIRKAVRMYWNLHKNR